MNKYDEPNYLKIDAGQSLVTIVGHENALRILAAAIESAAKHGQACILAVPANDDVDESMPIIGVVISREPDHPSAASELNSTELN